MGCELNFELNAKVGEANVVGVILAFGKLFGIINIVIFNLINLDERNNTDMMFGCAIMYLVS
jgi:hypothetical protein